MRDLKSVFDDVFDTKKEAQRTAEGILIREDVAQRTFEDVFSIDSTQDIDSRALEEIEKAFSSIHYKIDKGVFEITDKGDFINLDDDQVEVLTKNMDLLGIHTLRAVGRASKGEFRLCVNPRIDFRGLLVDSNYEIALTGTRRDNYAVNNLKINNNGRLIFLHVDELKNCEITTKNIRVMRLSELPVFRRSKVSCDEVMLYLQSKYNDFSKKLSEPYLKDLERTNLKVPTNLKELEKAINWNRNWSLNTLVLRFPRFEDREELVEVYCEPSGSGLKKVDVNYKSLSPRY